MTSVKQISLVHYLHHPVKDSGSELSIFYLHRVETGSRSFVLLQHDVSNFYASSNADDKGIEQREDQIQEEIPLVEYLGSGKRKFNY